MSEPTTGPTTQLRTGLRIAHDGQVFTVVELSGRRMLLRSQVGGELRQVEIGWLLSHSSTSVTGGGRTGDPSPATVLSAAGAEADEGLVERVAHLREVLTGYRLGSAELALEGEPRPQYAPGVGKMARYAAKAAELGIGVTTLRRWITAFEAEGPMALLPRVQSRSALGRVDPRWVGVCQEILAEHVQASRPTKALILLRIEERLAEKYGRGVVPVPASTKGYELLAELSRGSNAFTGSTKGKRSIANRPVGVYGRLRATRPGEYVMLDTTRLDVFAMEPVTCRWVQVELTAAMDLYDRCVTGLRLTPVSTKAVDVAGVLYETVRPASPDQARPGRERPALPFHGVPGTVVVNADKLADRNGTALLPSVATETIVYDHGKIYLSQHVQTVCAKLGISLQPARPATPTDKSPLERWFKTLSEGLLVALPGYKGADVHSRGLQVEEQAFYFLDELEAIIREWIQRIYHLRPHAGLTVPEVPGLEMSPLDMLEHGIARAGRLQILDRPDLAFDFLEVCWTSIQHYGVEIGTLRYNGPVLGGLRNRRSPYGGLHAGRWPVAVDPGDITRVWFQDPDDHRWHPLVWEHAAELGRPLSDEALVYARRLAAATHRFPDTKRALVELLERWDAGLTANPAERRMAARLSAQRLRLIGEDRPGTQDSGVEEEPVSALPSVARIAAMSTREEHRRSPGPGGKGSVAETTSLDGLEVGELGGDDEDDDCDAAFPGEHGDGEPSDEDFYTDVLESS